MITKSLDVSIILSNPCIYKAYQVKSFHKQTEYNTLHFFNFIFSSSTCSQKIKNVFLRFFFNVETIIVLHSWLRR